MSNSQGEPEGSANGVSTVATKVFEPIPTNVFKPTSTKALGFTPVKCFEPISPPRPSLKDILWYKKLTPASPITPDKRAVMTPSDEPAMAGLEPSPSIIFPSNTTPKTNQDVPDDPPHPSTDRLSTETSAVGSVVRIAEELPEEATSSIPTGLRESQPQPQSQPQSSMSAVTPPPCENPEQEQSTTRSTNGAARAVPSLTTFLDGASRFEPLGFFARDLQKAGISTVADLKIIARDPEAFRTKIPVLADLRERDEFQWFIFWKVLKNLMEGDRRELSANNLGVETDPIRKFVCSLGGGERIDSEAFANGLKGAGVLSERDLLVLSRDLERYTKNIPFLREFAASNKFGWAIFQVGLGGLADRSTPTYSQDPGTCREGDGYIKHFLDTIDVDKPLGHLVENFTKARLTTRDRLLGVADDIETALTVMPSIPGLASGDQLAWAMILAGLDNLVKSA